MNDLFFNPGDGQDIEISNPDYIEAAKWKFFEVDRPALLVPLEAQPAPIFVSPRNMNPGAASPINGGLALSYGGYFPKAGKYWAYCASAVKVAVVKLPVIAVVKPLRDGCSLATSSQVTLGAGAASTVIAVNANRRFVTIQNNGSTYARIRMDGTDPTSSTGIRLAPGATADLRGDELVPSAIRGIAESGTPVLDILEGT